MSRLSSPIRRYYQLNVCFWSDNLQMRAINCTFFPVNSVSTSRHFWIAINHSKVFFPSPTTHHRNNPEKNDYKQNCRFKFPARTVSAASAALKRISPSQHYTTSILSSSHSHILEFNHQQTSPSLLRLGNVNTSKNLLALLSKITRARARGGPSRLAALPPLLLSLILCLSSFTSPRSAHAHNTIHDIRTHTTYRLYTHTYVASALVCTRSRKKETRNTLASRQNEWDRDGRLSLLPQTRTEPGFHTRAAHTQRQRPREKRESKHKARAIKNEPPLTHITLPYEKCARWSALGSPPPPRAKHLFTRAVVLSLSPHPPAFSTSFSRKHRNNNQSPNTTTKSVSCIRGGRN